MKQNYPRDPITPAKLEELNRQRLERAADEFLAARGYDQYGRPAAKLLMFPRTTRTKTA